MADAAEAPRWWKERLSRCRLDAVRRWSVVSKVGEWFAPGREIVGTSITIAAATLVVVVIVLLQPVTLSDQMATWILVGFSVFMAFAASVLVRPGRVGPDLVLRLMFAGGAVAISIGIVHIALGARLRRPSGLWLSPEPLPAAFTTVGGTLIGFAAILWSIDMRRLANERDRDIAEHRARVDVLEASVASVELILDDCRRLSRDALEILHRTLAPFGSALLEPHAGSGRDGDGSALLDILGPPPATDELAPDMPEVRQLEVRPGVVGWVPVSVASLEEGLAAVGRTNPSMLRAFELRLDGLGRDLVAEATEWSRQYEPLRERLGTASPDVPIDLLPFVDDLEYLRTLVRLAATEDLDARRRGLLVVAHFGLVLAALEQRATAMQRGSDEPDEERTEIPDVGGVRHRGLSAESIAEYLMSELEKDENHQRYARPLARRTGTLPTDRWTIDLTWHWTDEFFGDVQGPSQGSVLQRNRSDLIREDHEHEDGPVRALVRILTSAGLRRELLERRAKPRLREFRNDSLLGATPNARNFWSECRKSMKIAELEQQLEPVLAPLVREHRADMTLRTLNRPTRLALAWAGLEGPRTNTMFRADTEFGWNSRKVGGARTDAARVDDEEHETEDGDAFVYDR